MVEQVSVPTPASDEVLVKVLAAGVCHSDLTVLDTKTVVHSVMNKDGFTLGHEGAGRLYGVICYTYAEKKLQG